MARTGRPPKIELAKLRELLDEGWSQNEIARFLGVTQPAVSYAVRVRLPRREAELRR